MEHLLHELLAGTRSLVWSTVAEGLSPAVEPPPVGLLCGSFNPLHEGHRELRRVAECLLSGTVGYELSAHNVDKASLQHAELSVRCRQFDEALLAITAAPTFVEKSTLLPETTFVVGVDTAVRIVDPRFYDSSHAQMREALTRIRSQGCRFLVAGRLVGEDFATLSDIDVPVAFADLFEAIPATLFRRDVSSSELRSG